MSLGVCLLLAGCASRANLDRLESQLREHEWTMAEAQEQLRSAQQALQVARGETETLRTQLAQAGADAILPEQAETLYAASGIHFHKLLSGAVDQDGRPGPEGLELLLVPHDSEGELIKLPGELRVEVLDLTQPVGQQQVASRTITVEEARRLWQRGFLGSGYRLELPWDKPPAGDELTVHGHLTTPDGRTFDSTLQVRVRPAGADVIPATVRAGEFQADPVEPHNNLVPAPLEPEILPREGGQAPLRPDSEVPQVVFPASAAKSPAESRRAPREQPAKKLKTSRSAAEAGASDSAVPQPNKPVSTSDVWRVWDIPARR